MTIRKNAISGVGILIIGLMPILALSDERPPKLMEPEKAFQKGDYKAVIRDCTETIEINAADGNAFALRGDAYAAIGHLKKAIADYTQSVNLNPEQADVYYRRGNVYLKREDYARAIADYKEALSSGPTSQSETTVVYNDLAWLLATCPKSKFRDGKQAVENAKGAWAASMERASYVMDTLAAAYAEAGDFSSAVKWEQKFLATPHLDSQEIRQGKKCLLLFEAGKPFHETE